VHAMFANCNDNLTKTDCRFNAILADLTDLNPGWSVSLIKIFMSCEVSVMLGGLIFSTIAIQIFIERSSVHLNFARIVIVFTSLFYIVAGSRIVLLLFQTGLISM
ncbi:hypothetical protein PMAYCL1PPCAC_32765, partial [Pristionchus mayeri]